MIGGTHREPNPVVVRFAGIVWGLASGSFALITLFYSGFRCDEGCQSPGPTISWQDTRDAWQWDLLTAVGYLMLLLAAVILGLALTWRLRSRALLRVAVAQALCISSTLAVVFLLPKREQEPPQSIVIEVPSDPFRIKTCNYDRCLNVTVRLSEGWAAYGRADVGTLPAYYERDIQRPYGPCSLRAYPRDGRLLRGMSSGVAYARRGLNGDLALLETMPAPDRRALAEPEDAAGSGLGAVAIVWAVRGEPSRTAVLFVGFGIGCPRDFPRGEVDSTAAIEAEQELVRALTISARLRGITPQP